MRPPHQASGQCCPIEQRFGDLDSIVQHYVEKHRAAAEMELDRFWSEPSLRVGIRQAVLARSPDGKKLDRQRRIPA